MTTPICWRNCSHNSIALQIWMQLSKTSYCTYGMYLLYRAKTNADLAIQSFAWKSCECFKAWFERLQMLWSLICCNTTISQHMMSLPHDRNQGVNSWTTVQTSASLLHDVARSYLHEIKTIIHFTYTTTNQKVSTKNAIKIWMKEWNFEASFQP